MKYLKGVSVPLFLYKNKNLKITMASSFVCLNTLSFNNKSKHLHQYTTQGIIHFNIIKQI